MGELGGSGGVAVAAHRRSLSDADHTYDSENGAAFFIATCACFERPEAAVTAALLLHHGSWWAWHVVAAVGELGGSGGAAVAAHRRSAMRTIRTTAKMGRHFSHHHVRVLFERAEAAVTAPVLLHHG